MTSPGPRPHAGRRSALDRWHGSITEPGSTPTGEWPQAATAYRSTGLVLHAPDDEAGERIRRAVTEVAARRDWVVSAGRSGVSLAPAESSVGPIDSREVVAELRRHVDPQVAAGVGLDHLMTTAEQFGGNPFAIGHGRTGLDRYGDSGYAGRGPVNFVVPTPRPGSPERAPRVVVLDTGLGDHPWFTAYPAKTVVTMNDGRTIGPEIDPASIKGIDADGTGAVANALLGTLASHSGHGTFIAGLIRQACPEADIVALAVMGADGIVAESTLTDALTLLADRQREEPGWADALVLSLGYYAETADDLAYNTALKRILVELGRLGVAVFCAAGNDATDRPSYPAAFAVDEDFAAPDVVPLVSVAALNPDGSVALFSNDGPWVTAEALGVNLVSTAPVTSDGSARAGVHVRGPQGRPRGGVDPDAFGNGFASWSGTSFAAPVLAGQYLRTLAEAGFPPIAERARLVPIGRGVRRTHVR
ncbi:Subtilase family protein [Nakamurella panacisegetis]|uniref:Subtilase family protein n=1 Tax=Nakamurella panacisegetis TaxID=1090615 RepID=A0A1H0RS98_9ACTN|nr:S8 family serine peptidase [Nakamurella panacisegetis]SDP32229.1 Subtilase family protein [Nakamurella panacisegetis]